MQAYRSDAQPESPKPCQNQA